MGEQLSKLQQRKRRYCQGMRALEGGDYSAAARVLLEVAAIDDVCGKVSAFYAAQAELHLGLACLNQRDFDAAAGAFTRALGLSPRNHTLPRYLARCFAQLGRFDESARLSDREVSLHPRDHEPRIRKALSLWADGQQESAIQTLEEGLLEQPGHTEWHFQLGVFWASREQYSAAIKALQQAVQLDSHHSEALAHLGLCYGALENSSVAVDYLSRAQQQAPHDPLTGLLLAMALRATSDPTTTHSVDVAWPVAPTALELRDIEELTQLITIEPEAIEAFVNLEEAQSREGISELLAAVIDRALQRTPDCAELHYHRAKICTRLGRREQALASCERALEINPQLTQALITQAKLYRQQNRRQEAEVKLLRVLSMGYEYADVYFELGCIYRDQGEHQRARESYHRALEINVGYQEARQALESLAA